MSRLTRTLRGPRDDTGSALVEFLGAALVLLVPVVYLVLVLGRLQAAAFAVEGAAREAARAVVTADDAAAGSRRAVAAVALALGDQGLPTGVAEQALSLTCSTAVCLEPGGSVTTQVALDVPLPGVPAWLQDVVPLTIPVSSSATAAVDTYVGRGG